MRFLNRQIFASSDPLGEFKQSAINKYHNCNFFSEENISFISTTLNRGEVNGQMVFEKIFTNGNITLQKSNYDSSYIIWKECALKINNNLSVNIDISDASFFIVTLHYGKHIRHDIFSKDDDLELYNDILGYLYQKQNRFPHLSSIQFVSPTLMLLENRTNIAQTKELIDIKDGKVKRLKQQF